MEVIALAAVLVAVIIINRGSPDDAADTQAAAQGGSETEAAAKGESGTSTDEVDLSFVEHRIDNDTRSGGDVDAPVVIVMFSDFQCPFCASWSHDTLPTMMDYVDDGELRIELREIAIFGEESERVTRAGYAASLQDSYWDFHNAMLKDGKHRSKSELDEDSLVSLAADLGLDSEQFEADLNSDEAQEDSDATAEEGYSLGTPSTPAFIIGGNPIIGAQPTEEFVTAVDDALLAAGDIDGGNRPP
ncbi:Protein-disulfide isomerase [Brevibacterium siliguriense]|uniref:Protein-disulfide isomerase n=1 Tax=Brevibacterium siliguriense TaxID=1136497 RepID=A0A1H1Q9G2_9MICO|nr:thioredoxin domain-containing protein [Brevibacterium siliguriense]SDS20075.1 Protein-disulfide isomerase [Brevibacterium siliguriense]